MAHGSEHLITASTRSLSGDPANYSGGLQDLGDGVYAWLQPNGGFGQSNCGLIVAENESAVISICAGITLKRNDFSTPLKVRFKGAPIRHVVNTHSNGDHWWGNAMMPPEATIITSQPSLNAMDLGIAARDGTNSKGARRRREMDARADRHRSAAIESIWFAPYDFTGVRLRKPTVTFSGVCLSFEVGSRTVQLVEVGPAHTPGDLLVFVPGGLCGVLCGDILFNRTTPIMSGTCPVSNWIAAIDTIASLGAKTVVPGHGPLAGPDDIAALHAYWCWLQAEVPALHARGWSFYRAAAELIASSDFRLRPRGGSAGSRNDRGQRRSDIPKYRASRWSVVGAGLGAGVQRIARLARHLSRSGGNAP